MKKRRPILIASILLGLVLLLLVSWLSVWTVLRTERGHRLGDLGNRQFVLGAGLPGDRWLVGIDRYSWGVSVAFLANWKDQESYVSQQYSAQSIPAWSRASRPPSDLPYGINIVEVAAGWPITSLRGHWRLEGRSPYGASPYGSIGYVDRVVEEYPIVLPLIPIWPNVIFNTAFWSLVAFALMHTATSTHRGISRAVRRSKGRCPSCGYDIHGLSTCPECGEVLKTDGTMKA